MLFIPLLVIAITIAIAMTVAAEETSSALAWFERIDTVYDNAKDLRVISVKRLHDLFQTGISSMIVLHDQNHAVRLLDDRKRVDDDAHRRGIKDDEIEFRLGFLDKAVHILARKKLRGVRRDSAVGHGVQILDLCGLDDLLRRAFAVEEVSNARSGLKTQNIVHLRTSEVAVDDQNLCVDLLCQRDSDIDRGDRFALAL